MNKQEQYHNQCVEELYNTIKEKGYYPYVLMEVPYHKTSKLERLAGQADIVTYDGDKIVYWEVKTSSPSHQRSRLRKQSRAWFTCKEISQDIPKYFVSINPRNTYKSNIGQFRRIHSNDIN